MNAMTTRSDQRNIRTALYATGEATWNGYALEMDGIDSSIAIYDHGEYLCECDSFADLIDFLNDLY